MRKRFSKTHVLLAFLTLPLVAGLSGCDITNVAKVSEGGDIEAYTLIEASPSEAILYGEPSQYEELCKRFATDEKLGGSPEGKWKNLSEGANFKCKVFDLYPEYGSYLYDFTDDGTTATYLQKPGGVRNPFYHASSIQELLRQSPEFAYSVNLYLRVEMPGKITKVELSPEASRAPQVKTEVNGNSLRIDLPKGPPPSAEGYGDGRVSMVTDNLKVSSESASSGWGFLGNLGVFGYGLLIVGVVAIVVVIVRKRKRAKAS